MGCSNSKDDTADLAGNFFGDEPSVKKPALSPTDIPPSAYQPAPVKSALAKKNHPATVVVTTPIKQQPTTSSATTVSRSPDDSGGKKKNGRPTSSGREGNPKVSSPALERSSPEVKASPQTTSMSSSDRTNGTAKKSNYNNKTSSPRKPKRKNDFVAPPSSESFVTNPAEPNRTAPNKVQAATTKSEFTLPPPPPNELASNPTTSKDSPRHEEDTKETGNDYDDDFSVAPSLATTYRSVVKTSFDQIYERGKKVRIALEYLVHRTQEFVIPFYVLTHTVRDTARVRCVCASLYRDSSTHETELRHQASRSFKDVLGGS
jgi:hypothetical protein